MTGKKMWFGQKTWTPGEQLLFEQERAVLSATEEIWHMMNAEDLTKEELAKRLGRSKTYITRALSGGQNMTLRTFAALAWACGYTVEFRLSSARRAVNNKRKGGKEKR